MELVLSLFPGLDLLGHAFTEEGFTVVRGPDPIYNSRSPPGRHTVVAA